MLRHGFNPIRFVNRRNEAQLQAIGAGEGTGLLALRRANEEGRPMILLSTGNVTPVRTSNRAAQAESIPS